MKNWTGNKNSIYKTLGASSHSKEERQCDDYYATDPVAAELLLRVENFSDVLEPACGEGHLSKVFERHGINTTSYDMVDRGYGEVRNFMTINRWDGDIVTNPPYKWAKEFIEHALDIVQPGSKVAMFLKIQFLEGKKRKALFLNNPPKTIYVSSSRILCAKNGDFEGADSSAVAYAWFVWEKGFCGNTIVRWIN